MIDNFKNVKWSTLFFVLALPLLLFLFARCNIKTELTENPFDVTEEALLYSYGLGLIQDNNWLGHVKCKVAEFYPAGTIKSEFYYDENGIICSGTSYYETGQIECTGPLSDSKLFGRIMDDGITEEYYENGRLRTEYGRKPGGCCLLYHGIKREYSEDGKLELEEYFINDRQCSKEEWLAWMKTHPEDVKYYDRNYDSAKWYYYCTFVIAAVLAGIVLYWKFRRKIVFPGTGNISLFIIIFILAATSVYGIYFALKNYGVRNREFKDSIIKAVKKCDLEKVKELCGKNSADIKNIECASYPLNFAVLYSDADPENMLAVMKFMLSKGCDIKSTDDSGYTFPMRCINREVPAKIIEEAIKAGGNVHFKNPEGNTALHIAASFSDDNKEYAEILLKSGADINAINLNGNTPLAEAAVNGNWEMSEFLLNHGADPEIKLNGGKSLREIVKERIADPVFANEKSSYEKLLRMMEKRWNTHSEK